MHVRHTCYVGARRPPAIRLGFGQCQRREGEPARRYADHSSRPLWPLRGPGDVRHLQCICQCSAPRDSIPRVGRDGASRETRAPDAALSLKSGSCMRTCVHDPDYSRFALCPHRCAAHAQNVHHVGRCSGIGIGLRQRSILRAPPPAGRRRRRAGGVTRSANRRSLVSSEYSELYSSAVRTLELRQHRRLPYAYNAPGLFHGHRPVRA